MSPCGEFDFQKCSLKKSIVEANPDIAGIGIIISFLITTVLAVIAGFYHFYFYYITKMKTIGHHGGLPFNWLWASPGFWAQVFEAMLLALNDSQLFTGTAVQIVSLIQHCEITVYHLRIVGELAFLSTVTHLITVVALSEYFMDNAALNTPRVLVMLLNIGLLGYTTWFAYFYETASDLDDSLQLGCYYAGYRPPVRASFIAHWIFLLLATVIGHLTVFLSMYSKRFHEWLTNSYSGVALLFFRTGVIVPAYTIYGLVRSSQVLRHTHALGNPSVEIHGSEREWGFGQILSMLLLAVVILPGLETAIEITRQVRNSGPHGIGIPHSH